MMMSGVIFFGRTMFLRLWMMMMMMMRIIVTVVVMISLVLLFGATVPKYSFARFTASL